MAIEVFFIAMETRKGHCSSCEADHIRFLSGHQIKRFTPIHAKVTYVERRWFHRSWTFEQKIRQIDLAMYRDTLFITVDASPLKV